MYYPSRLPVLQHLVDLLNLDGFLRSRLGKNTRVLVLVLGVLVLVLGFFVVFLGFLVLRRGCLGLGSAAQESRATDHLGYIDFALRV